MGLAIFINQINPDFILIFRKVEPLEIRKVTPYRYHL